MKHKKILLIMLVAALGLTAFASDTVTVTMPSSFDSGNVSIEPDYVRVAFDVGAGIGTSTKDNPMKVKPVFELDLSTKFKDGLGVRPVLHFDMECLDEIHLNLSLGARYYWERVVVGMTLGMDNFKYFDISAHLRYRFPVGTVNYREKLFVHVEGLVHYIVGADNWRFGLLGGIEL